MALLPPPVLVPRPLPHQFSPTQDIFSGICSLAGFDGTCTKNIHHLFERPPENSSSEMLLVGCFFSRLLPDETSLVFYSGFPWQFFTFLFSL